MTTNNFQVTAANMGISVLEFKAGVDRQCTLRLHPFIDGTPLASLIGAPVDGRGLTGLALGSKDVALIEGWKSARSLPLLSCVCGAYDVRVTAKVCTEERLVRWREVTDERSGRLISELSFDAEAYQRAFRSARKALLYRLPWYWLRVFLSVRDDSMPGGLGSFVTWAAAGVALWGCRFVGEPGRTGWAPLGVHWAIWLLVLVGLSLALEAFQRWRNSGHIWLDGPTKFTDCPWHDGRRYLAENWRRSTGLLGFQ